MNTLQTISHYINEQIPNIYSTYTSPRTHQSHEHNIYLTDQNDNWVGYAYLEPHSQTITILPANPSINDTHYDLADPQSLQHIIEDITKLLK